jgi:hypothetical protein
LTTLMRDCHTFVSGVRLRQPQPAVMPGQATFQRLRFSADNRRTLGSENRTDRRPRPQRPVVDSTTP